MIDMPYSEKPYIVDETNDFAVVYKPPRIHCAPLKEGGTETVLGWYSGIFPDAAKLRGRKPVEGGLVHRLDFDTHGLVLIAKNQSSLDTFLTRQEQGRFIKEYEAVSAGFPVTQNLQSNLSCSLPGFPPPPFQADSALPDAPFCIKSAFRPYGPGRKTVRPVLNITRDISKPYQTEVIAITKMAENRICFTVRLQRGFRHQIRCHLSWIGRPILHDRLYGYTENIRLPEEPCSPGGFLPLGLCAQGLFFPDPCDGRAREYRIASKYW